MNQPEPTKKDLPVLFSRLRAGVEGETANSALASIEYVLEGLKLLPRQPERPSEKAMRLAKLRRRQPLGVNPTLDEQQRMDADRHDVEREITNQKGAK